MIYIYDTIVQIITHIRYYRQDMQLYAILYEIPIKDSFLNLSRISRPLRNFTKYPMPCPSYGISHKYIYVICICNIYYVILSNIQFPINYKNIAAIYHNPVPVCISHYTCKHLKRRKLEMMLSKKSFVERAIYFSLSLS